MPTFGNVVLNEATYVPNDISGGVTRWMDRTNTSPQGFSELTLSVRPPSNGSKNYRVTSKLRVPVVQSESSACGCEGDFIRQIACEVTFTIDASSTTSERTEAYERFKDWVNDATNFEAAFQDLIPTYG